MFQKWLQPLKNINNSAKDLITHKSEKRSIFLIVYFGRPANEGAMLHCSPLSMVTLLIKVWF